MTNLITALLTIIVVNTGHTTTITCEDYQHVIKYNWKGDIIYEEVIYYNEEN